MFGVLEWNVVEKKHCLQCHHSPHTHTHWDTNADVHTAVFPLHLQSFQTQSIWAGMSHPGRAGLRLPPD